MELKPFELGWDQLAPVSKYWEVTQFMYLGLMDNFDDDNWAQIEDRECWKQTGQALQNDLLINYLEGTCYYQNWLGAVTVVHEALAVFFNIQKRLDVQEDTLEDMVRFFPDGSPEYIYAEALEADAHKTLFGLNEKLRDFCEENYDLLAMRDFSRFRPRLTEAERAELLQQQKDQQIQEARERLQSKAREIHGEAVQEEKDELAPALTPPPAAED